jgi:mono/diheme cytochrome c family protein
MENRNDLLVEKAGARVRPRNLSASGMASVIFLFCAALFLFVPAVSAQETSSGLYKSKCALCHAPDGSASGPVGKQMNVPNLRLRQAQALTNEQWIQIVEDGKGRMPAFKGRLSDEQIRQVVSYLRELTRPK